ncbi:Os01g0285950 [Oryza sativa Japonica Group]|uniref:Os01g0285950 protein n=1 Tax=Oryza sativa subsp. japonica TaxID=39947 RepID=A0A0N7KCS4_ORYSJ|nr:Os01g0285950 [Oryza sativa Japonica Group]
MTRRRTSLSGPPGAPPPSSLVQCSLLGSPPESDAINAAIRVAAAESREGEGNDKEEDFLVGSARGAAATTEAAAVAPPPSSLAQCSLLGRPPRIQRHRRCHPCRHREEPRGGRE